MDMNEDAEPRRLTRRELREKWLAEQSAEENSSQESSDSSEDVPDLSYLEKAQETDAEIWDEPAEDTQVKLRRRRQPSAEVDGEQTQNIDDPAPTQPFSVDDLQALQAERQSLEQDLTAASATEADLGQKQLSEDQSEPESTLQTEKAEEYSFPDIQPLDEERSVFDEESDRASVSSSDTLETTEDDSYNFEDVLERAIADENTSVHNSTAALILPSFPDTDLSGPIGATGELFITGSFELPKSLSETGGHSNFIDSFADSDQETDVQKESSTSSTDENASLDIFADLETTEFDVTPKSARKAISAKNEDSNDPTTPITKRDGKKPLIFGLVGGGLILVIVAGGILLFNSGLFG
ncbi:MAG TPA: hypothetical protein VLZ31_08030 [Microbacteriaceae bacterium]|nr:hypothetical protein [Microbacteriaceae bacterium]